MSFPFTKMQGAGNDFIVVAGEDRDWAALAPALCERRSGVGADGILVALPLSGEGVRMRMYNPDGTEDECGNGLRCLALYALRRGLVHSPAFAVETLSGPKRVQVFDSGAEEAAVTAHMGQADLRPASVPVNLPGDRALDVPLEVEGESLTASILSTGTAHTVLFELPDEERFQRLSPLLEHHPLFPERTSVMWTAVDSPEHARVRIWERGAGETLACGTGAAAVVAAGFLTGRMGPRAEVASRGGVLTVEVSEELALRVTGPAALVYEGSWSDDS